MVSADSRRLKWLLLLPPIFSPVLVKWYLNFFNRSLLGEFTITKLFYSTKSLYLTTIGGGSGGWKIFFWNRAWRAPFIKGAGKKERKNRIMNTFMPDFLYFFPSNGSTVRMYCFKCIEKLRINNQMWGGEEGLGRKRKNRKPRPTAIPRHPLCVSLPRERRPTV